MAVDEALVVLAEAILLAGLLVLSARLWSARYDPYPQLIAQLINSSPTDAELFIALPKPVRVEYSRVCQAGVCYSIAPLKNVSGRAWDWMIIYKRRVVLATGGAIPKPNVTLAIQVLRVDYRSRVLGPAQGVQVRIDGRDYATDAAGWVNVTLPLGSSCSVEVRQTFFNSGWGRYTFWRWSDGSPLNPRSFTVMGNATVAAYVWDERLLKVTYTSGGTVRVNGVQVGSGYSDWFKYGASVTLQAVPHSGYALMKWMWGVNTDELTDYRYEETVSDSGSGFNIELSRSTSSRFSGYVELALSINITPPQSYSYSFTARITACGQNLVSDSGSGTGSLSKTYTWKGNLPCTSSITFALSCNFLPTRPRGGASIEFEIPIGGRASMLGRAAMFSINPLTVTMDNGYHFRAEFGTP